MIILDDKIQKLYDKIAFEYTTSDLDANGLALKYKISANKIRYHLKKRNIKLDSNKSRTFEAVNKNRLKNFVNHYAITKSLNKTATHFNINYQALSNYLKSLNINVINYQNKLKIRENLFKKIETKEDAYWLGFIYADGYISNKGYFELSLKHDDYDHLLKFAKYCEFNTSKVVKKQKTNFENCYRCRIGFATQHLKQRFFDLGIVPRKSLTLKFPTNKQVPDHLIRHFIRGYFDGDGCISKYKNKNIPVISLLGTKNILTHINNVFPEKSKIYKRGKIYTLTSSCIFGYNNITWMYLDSKIYLNRKFKLFDEIFKNYEGRIPKKVLNITTKELYPNVKSAALKLNVSISVIYHSIDRNKKINNNNIKYLESYFEIYN